MMERFSDEITHYNQQGFAIFRGVLDESLIAEARSHVSWLLEKNPDLRPEQLHHLLHGGGTTRCRIRRFHTLLLVGRPYLWRRGLLRAAS